MQNKNIYQRLYIGVKKGLLTPTLPEHILELQKKPHIRILRVLGGLSIIFILTNRLKILGTGVLYTISLIISLFIMFIYLIYVAYMSYYRIKQFKKVMKSKDLDVRNSPLDKFASLAARLIWCSKNFCEVAAPIGIMYGGMAGIDELRKAKGYEPLFLPFLADLVLPDNEVSKLYKENQKLGAQLISNNKESSLISQERSLVEYLRENKILTNNESSEWESHKKNESYLEQNTSNAKSKILNNLEIMSKFKK